MKGTPAQQEAVTSRSRYLCVDAGAGSGKTRVLVERVVDLLAGRCAKLDEIVAITFTDKAAAEMKARLRAAFRQHAPPDDPAAMSYWRDLERRVETARISTIHAFCTGLLREHALQVGADPDFTVLAEAEATLLRTEVVRDTVHALLEADDEAAVRAGAALGTGQLMRLLETMLNKRALLERLRDRFPLEDPGALVRAWAQTVEAEWKARLERVKDGGEWAGLRDDLAAFEGQCTKASAKREVMRVAMIAAIEEVVAGAGPTRAAALLEGLAGLKASGAKSANWPSNEVFKRLGALEGRVVDLAKAHAPPVVDAAVEREAARLTCDFHAVYEKVAAAFHDAKTARTGLDFDNLIADALTMLRERDQVRARVARGIKHLLIDEFQDTDSAQLAIARLLAEAPGGPALFIVGDAKQSIYDFRGAEVDVFQQEKGAARDVVRLDKNFRSLPDVMAFVNEFFATTGLLEAVEPQYHPLETHRSSAQACRVEFLVPEREDGGNADAYRRREAESIAARIAALCGGTAAATVYDNGLAAERPADYGDVAILFRSMKSVHLYEEPLRTHAIPYQVVAGAGFYERQEILDVRNVLTVAVDPWNEMALLGFLRSPLAGLSDDALVRLCRDHGLVEAFRGDAAPDGLAPDQASRLAEARGLVASLRAHAELPLPAFLRFFLGRTGFEAILLGQYLGVQKACNVRKLLDLAGDFARTRPPSLGAFVQYLEEMAHHEEIREGEAAAGPESAGVVTLMTIHKAKGLEWPVVVIPDCSREFTRVSAQAVAVHRRFGLVAKVTDAIGNTAEPAIFDAMKRDRRAVEQAERARLLYVAMTRARDWLILSGAPEAKKGTWLESFDAAYGVLDRADGEHLEGRGWQACVRRRPATADAKPPVTPEAAPADREALEKRAGPVEPRSRAQRTFSVTALLNVMAFPCEDGLSAAPSRAALAGLPAPKRGELVHRLLERWDGAADVVPVIESIVRRAGVGLGLRRPVREMLADVAARFAESSLGARMVRDGVTAREAPFALRVGNALVTGAIDAILADGTVVDYKTGARRPADHARYEAQLCLYAEAMRTLFAKAPPGAVLYYVDADEVCDVDIAPARVEAVMAQARAAIEDAHGPPAD